MNALISAALQSYTRPDSANFQQIGELIEVMKDFKTLRDTKTPYVKQLVHEDGRNIAIVFSKQLSAALAAKEITEDQLGFCVVARTTKEDGTGERFRLTLPTDFNGGESTAVLIERFAKASRPRKSFNAQAAVDAI